MWLHIPKSCLSSAESECSTGPSDLCFQNLEQFATLSGKHTRQRSWRRGWKNKLWMRLLSGLTLPPSTVTRGVDLWISSLHRRPVSRIASLESELETQTKGATEKTEGLARSRTFLESFPSVNPPWYFLKMFQPGLEGDTSKQSEKNYRDWVMQSKNRSSLLRKALERAIKESGCLSLLYPHTQEPPSTGGPQWPTPQAMDQANAHPPRLKGDRQTQDPSCPGSYRGDLKDFAMTWQTPRSHEVGEYTLDGGCVEKKRATLTGQAQLWTTPQAHDVTMRGSGQKPCSKAGNACLARDAANWPTPNAGGGGGDRGPNPGLDAARARHAARGVNKQISLRDAAVRWPTPNARDFKSGEASQDTMEKNSRPLNDAVTHWEPQASLPQVQPTPDGETSSEITPGLPQLLPKKRLNPLFDCWVMSMPPLWTRAEVINSGLLGTLWSASVRRWRYESSLLVRNLFEAVKDHIE